MRIDPFSITWDAVVVGGGLAGLAAASALAGRGSVLLIERRAALAWECGWCLERDLGEDDAPGWRAWLDRLAGAGGMPGGLPDGAQWEIQAHALVRERGIGLLCYAAPVALERADGLITSAILGTKSGLRRVSARRWIDASDGGELLALAAPGWRAPAPLRQRIAIAWRRAGWSSPDRTGEALGGRWSWRASGWDDERILALDLPGTEPVGHRAWLPAIAALRSAAGADLDQAVVSHSSIMPCPGWGCGAQPGSLSGNLACAVPSIVGADTLSGRWALGAAAAAGLPRMPMAGPAADAAPTWPEATTLEAGVLVAGLGTGGALAAIAAGRGGADVLGADPLPFAGGIGSGGGIHAYYYGVRGGLQEEVDARVRAALPLFGAPAQISCFHPDAKKAVLDGMLAEAGVRRLEGAILVAARRSGRRIAEALFATPSGPLRVRARAWIDGTGDGDLAAAAGCASRYGRAGDGRLHAYTQSAACTRMDEAKPKVFIINYDSGFTDASDPADLTRARHEGVLQHLRARVERAWRPAQICPAIGLRQDRHIVCDAELGLNDLIRRRRFPDAIALVGAHYDNHATDYEHESADAMLWVWACDAWSVRIAGELPYGAIVPRDVDDLWLASRCLAVSEEAHHCVRMQRDMQRIGEAAGLAAVLAAGRGSRAIDVAELRRRLAASGALPADAGLPGDPLTGITVATVADCRQAPAASGDPLRSGDAAGLWILSHDRTADLAPALVDADPAVSFRAALILAWRGDAAARPRLLSALQSREDGLPAHPRGDQVPRWFAALAFLRLVPAAAMLEALGGIADWPAAPFRARVAVALALDALVAAEPAAAASALAMLPRLLAFPAPDAVGGPRRGLLHPPIDGGNHFAVAEDDAWQLHLVVARIRRRLGLSPLPQSQRYADDPRAGVRRAFSALTAPAAAATARG